MNIISSYSKSMPSKDYTYSPQELLVKNIIELLGVLCVMNINFISIVKNDDYIEFISNGEVIKGISLDLFESDNYPKELMRIFGYCVDKMHMLGESLNAHAKGK